MAAEKVQLARLGFTRGEPPPSTQFGGSGGRLGASPQPMQPAPQNIPGLLRDTLDLAQPTNRLRGARCSSAAPHNEICWLARVTGSLISSSEIRTSRTVYFSAIGGIACAFVRRVSQRNSGTTCDTKSNWQQQFMRKYFPIKFARVVKWQTRQT